MVARYVDWNRGSDSYDGSTPALAWKNLTKIDDAAAAAGDVFLLADDSEWSYGLSTRIIPPTSWAGVRNNPIIIGKYSPLSSSSGKPTIKWRNLITAGEWTYSAPNNAWTYTAPGNVGGLALVRLGSTWDASRIDGTQLPLASIDGRWTNSGTTFYLYAPAGTNPTDYYGEVMLSTEAGFFTISSARGWVTLQDLHFAETGCAIFGYSGTAADVGVVAQRISGRTVSGLIRFLGDTTNAQLYGYVRDIDVSDWGSTVISSSTTGNGGILACEITGGTISDGLHTFAQGAVYLQNRAANLRTKVSGMRISGVRWGSRNKVTDGCAIYTETGNDAADIYNNIVSDSVCAFQDNSGQSSRWWGNLVVNCGTAMRMSDQNTNNAAAHEFFGNTCIVGASVTDAMAPFGGIPAEAGWRGYKATATGTITSLSVRNNVFVNTGSLQAAAILTPEITPSASTYINNAASGGYTNVAKREYTATVETSTGSVTADPMLSSGYRPMTGSPLIGAGAHLGYSRDADGIQRPKPPSIGAFDVATLRRSPTADPSL